MRSVACLSILSASFPLLLLIPPTFPPLHRTICDSNWGAISVANATLEICYCIGVVVSVRSSFLVSLSDSASFIVRLSFFCKTLRKKMSPRRVWSLSWSDVGWFCRLEALASPGRRFSGDMFGRLSKKVISRVLHFIQWTRRRTKRIKGRCEGSVRGQRTYPSHWMKPEFCLHRICTPFKSTVHYFQIMATRHFS